MHNSEIYFKIFFKWKVGRAHLFLVFFFLHLLAKGPATVNLRLKPNEGRELEGVPSVKREDGQRPGKTLRKCANIS